MVEVRAIGAIGSDRTSGFTGGGGGVRAGLRAGGPVFFELGADVLARASQRSSTDPPEITRLGPAIHLTPAVRVFAVDPWARPAALSLAVGGGLDVRVGDAPVVNGLVFGEVAVDGRVSEDWAIRAAVGYGWSTAESGGVLLSIGARWMPPAAAPVEVPEPTPQVDDRREWLGYPVCGWRSPAEAERVISALELPSTSAAPPAAVDAGAQVPVPGASQGSVVIAGQQGDEIWMLGKAFPADDEGTFSTRVGAGALEVIVVGGGRSESISLFVEEDHTTWRMTQPPPPPVQVNFAAGSAELTPENVDYLRGLASRTKGWTWFLAGSHSADGTADVNLALAVSRAEAVKGVLVGAGVPAEQVRLEEPYPPEPSLPPELQRAVRLRAVPAGSEP
jgi:outer membrane protein OmpA-like peptidoglycan-associated protein